MSYYISTRDNDPSASRTATQSVSIDTTGHADDAKWASMASQHRCELNNSSGMLTNELAATS